MVIIALMLPLIFLLGGIVIAVGSWFTHGRHLQTKVDASALAAGGAFGFPCASDIDMAIRDTARTYVGPHTAADGTVVSSNYNPQVSGVGSDKVFVTLNQADWWDDTFPGADFTTPAGSPCAAMTLDVKATENDTPFLFGWLPIWPDVKRKARVQINEVEGLTGILPIAVRVPKPLSMAAVFYNEATGDILSARYLCEDNAIFGLPAGLGGWSSYSQDPSCTASGSWASSWARFRPATDTGVLIATSLHPACAAPGASAPCLNTNVATFPTVNAFCNQGSGATPRVQIAECFYSTGTFPSASPRAGLQFIRGYPTGDPGVGAPELRGAHLTPVGCTPGTAYFNSGPNTSCQAQLTASINLGDLRGLYPNVPPPGQSLGPLRASDVEVRYRLVRSDGSSSCNYGNNCDLTAASPNGTGIVTFSTQGNGSSPHLPLTQQTRANAVAIQIRLRNAQNAADADCTNGNFNVNCRWFYTGSGNPFGTSVAPTDGQILASPVQRSFMGGINTSGPFRWLRLTQDSDCNGVFNAQDGPAATAPTTSDACFYIDLGQKGGDARDQDEPPIIFNEGTGSSQMGGLDCDPNIGQGQILIDGIINGCSPYYAANKFTSDPLCPAPNQIFNWPGLPAPFDDWPPMDCIKTRPTSQMSQILRGLNGRIFGDQVNPSCPADDASQFVQGRNYWHRENNGYDGANFAWNNDTPQTNDDTGNKLRDDDPRLVTLFFSTYDSFTGPGQEVYPVVAFGSFYITGWGTIRGNGTIQVDDPCDGGNSSGVVGAGNVPPSDADLSGGSSGGRVVWGHFVDNVVPGPNSIPSTRICTPLLSLQPCVPVLIE
jgi:hypothetical protein